MKKTIMTLFVFLFLIGAAAVLLANGKPEKVSLVFYQWWTSDPVRNANLTWEIQEFQKKYPNVEIKPASITNENYWTKLMVDISGNTEGDILALDTGNGMTAYNSARPGGAFAKLDEYIKGYTLDDGTSLEKDIMLMDGMKRDGQYIALPFIWFVAEHTFYRKSHLKDAGLSESDIKTSDGFRTSAIKLTKDTNGDGNIDRYGFGHPVYQESLTRWWHMHWLWTAGGGIFPKEKEPYTAKNLIFNSPENIIATEYLADLLKKAAPPGDKKYFELFPMFFNGDISMLQVALWGIPFVKEGMQPKGSFENDLGVAPFPAFNYKGQLRQPVYVAWGNPLAISSRCKNPKIAFDFIAFLHSKEVQKREGVSVAPVNKKTLEQDYAKEYPFQYDYIKMARNYEFRIAPDILPWTEFDKIVQQAMNSALLGAQTPKEALDWGQSEMVKALKE